MPFGKFSNIKGLRLSQMVSFVGVMLLFSFGCANEKGVDLEGYGSGIVKSDSTIIARLIEKSESQYIVTDEAAVVFDLFLREAETLAIKDNAKRQLVDIYNIIGKRYRNRALYAQAMSFHQRALPIAEELNDPKLIADVYNQMGTVYRRIDENSKALDMHMNALVITEANNDSFGISVSINGLGNVSYNLGRELSAIEYFHRSLNLSKKMNNVLGMAINTNNIGDVYQKLGRADSALHYHFQSLDYNSQINSRIGQAICYNSIGKVYTAQGQYGLALDYLFKALKANLEVQDGMYIATSYTIIGKTYLQDNHPNDAIVYLDKGLRIARNIGSKYTAEEASGLLSDAYEQKNEFKRALEFHKLSTAYRDSILNEKNIFHLSTAEADYDNKARQMKVEELSKQTLLQKAMLDKQRIYVAAAISFAVLILVIASLVFYQVRLRNRNRSLKFQQRLLRSQMNPHFIFNALSAIQVFILENDMENSNRFLSEFSKLMRQVLKSSNYEYISINEEKEILQYYLHLQQLRFSPPFEFELDVDEDLIAANALVPPMLIQPFVENSIEHGIKGLVSGGKIMIRFRKLGGGIEIVVEDNGLGIDYTTQLENASLRHESMAMRITEERLEIIKKDTKRKTFFEVYDKRSRNLEEQGTVVRFELPMIRFVE